MHYKCIPHKIMIEKYMGKAICDYKFLCFNGKPEFCWIDIDRFGNHKRNIYDMNWNLFSMYIALALLGVGMVIYAKIEDRKKGK